MKQKLIIIKEYLKYMFNTAILMWNSIYLLIKYFCLWVWYSIFTPKDVEYLEDIKAFRKLNIEIINFLIKLGQHKQQLPFLWNRK